MSIQSVWMNAYQMKVKKTKIHSNMSILLTYNNKRWESNIGHLICSILQITTLRVSGPINHASTLTCISCHTAKYIFFLNTNDYRFPPEASVFISSESMSNPCFYHLHCTHVIPPSYLTIYLASVCIQLCALPELAKKCLLNENKYVKLKYVSWVCGCAFRCVSLCIYVCVHVCVVYV